MEDCLFCKIVAGEIPSEKLYEDDKVLVFHDIDPKAPFHVLIIPSSTSSRLPASIRKTAASWPISLRSQPRSPRSRI